MGVTIIDNSEKREKTNKKSKIALVLAGGAVSGGAYKVGALKALDDYLSNKKVIDLDVFIGLSAGAILATALAAGVIPEELMKNLKGKSKDLDKFGLTDFLRFNYEFITKPIKLPFGFFNSLYTYFSHDFKLFQKNISTLIKENNVPEFLKNLPEVFLDELLVAIGNIINLQSRYLPRGFFDNRGIEVFFRKNAEKKGLPNDFVRGFEISGKELYVVATDINNGKRAVFGHDETNDVSISEAVQASTALPVLFPPTKLGDGSEEKYYIDGGIRKTANLSLANEKKADLIICFNPFRPIDYGELSKKLEGKIAKHVVDQGVLPLYYQIIRVLLGSRLKSALEKYKGDRNFKADIILIEPTRDDYSFFLMNPLNFLDRARAAKHGYESVRESINKDYSSIEEILNRHGIEMTKIFVEKGHEKIKELSLRGKIIKALSYSRPKAVLEDSG